MGSIQSGVPESQQPLQPYTGVPTSPDPLNTPTLPSAEQSQSMHHDGALVNPRPVRSFTIHVAVDAHGALYLVNASSDDRGSSVEQKLYALIAAQSDASPRTVAFKQEHRVELSFVCDHGKIPASLVGVEGIPLSRAVLRLDQRKVLLIGATSVAGKELLTESAVQPLVIAPEVKQLTLDQKKWLSRQARVIALQHNPAKILSESELRLVQATGAYPGTAVKHLHELEESFKVLFQIELKHDVPKSKKAQRPSWAAEFLKLAHSLRENLDTPAPYFDALLTVLDPQNTKYRSMAHCNQMRAFLEDCTHLGLMPNITEAGRAKIVVKPVIERLLPLTSS